MAPQHAFDPHTFLAKVGAGRTLVACPKQRPIFTQGEAAATTDTPPSQRPPASSEESPLRGHTYTPCAPLGTATRAPALLPSADDDAVTVWHRETLYRRRGYQLETGASHGASHLLPEPGKRCYGDRNSARWYPG